MKNYIKIISFLACTYFLLGAKETNPVDFTLNSATDSTKFVLSENKGKYVALHFLLKTECPHCMQLTSAYVFNAHKLPDVVQVFIKPDEKAELDKWTYKVPDMVLSQYAIFSDPGAALAKKFKVKSGYFFHNEDMNFPCLIILDPNGKEVFRYTGVANSDRFPFDKFEAKIKELKAVALLNK